MWDRFKGAVPQKLGRSHNQQRHDRTSAHGASGYSYQVRGGPPPPRPPRDFVQGVQGHPQDQAPAFLEAPPHRNSYRPDGHRQSIGPNRPASSVYSQPSPIHTNFASSNQQPAGNYAYNDAHDISPPSSPELPSPRDGGVYPQPDISPIDEDDEEMSQIGGHSLRGNIPSLRRERRHKMDAENNQVRESRSRERMRLPVPQQRTPEQPDRGYHGGEVRWDPATGELTSSVKGRPSQVKPAEYAKGLGHSPPRNPSEPPVINSTTPFDERVERVRRIAPPGFATGGAEKNVTRSPNSHVTPPRKTPSPMTSPTAYDPAAEAFAAASRPEWKGGSGRTAIVKPVHDIADVAPLNIPPKKNIKRASPSSSNPRSATGASKMDTIMASPPVSPTPPETRSKPQEAIVSPPQPTTLLPLEDISESPIAAYPSPPHSGGDSGVAQFSADMVAQTYAQHARSGTPTSVVRRKPTPSQLHQQQASISSTYSESDPYNYAHYTATHPLPPRNPNQLEDGPEDWVQSTSNLSYDERPSDYAHQMSDVQGESVMDRRRPKLRSYGSDGSSQGSDGEPIKINLKDAQWAPEKKGMRPMDPYAPKMASTMPSVDDEASSRPGSIFKSLPPAPPETTATGRVDQLNAQLRGLANRRINLTRSIKQMTELMPTDNIMASAEVLRKREIERRKVEALRTELADVQREEYELGIKLHRAYKRIDRNGEYEPTTLWVRRVTR